MVYAGDERKLVNMTFPVISICSEMDTREHSQGHQVAQLQGCHSCDFLCCGQGCHSHRTRGVLPGVCDSGTGPSDLCLDGLQSSRDPGSHPPHLFLGTYMDICFLTESLVALED